MSAAVVACAELVLTLFNFYMRELVLELVPL